MSENPPPALEHNGVSSIDRAPMPAPARNRMLLVVMGVIVVAVLLYQVFSAPAKPKETGPKVTQNNGEEFRPTPRQSSAPIFEIKPPVAGPLPSTIPTGPAVAPLPVAPPSAPVVANKNKKEDEDIDVEARRRAPLLIGGGAGGVLGAPSSTDSGSASSQGAAAPGAAPGSSTPESHAEFLRRTENTSSKPPVKSATAYSVRQLEYRIFEGKLISGVLETAISSDLPGQVRAMIDEDVYGEKGRVILLPRMTRLIGEYSSTVRQGQTRVLISWRRAIRPDGIGINIASPGTDGMGTAGMGGDVDNHFTQRFVAAGLVTIMGGMVDAQVARARAKANQTSTSTINIDTSESIGKELVSLTRDIMKDMSDIKPTITINQGASLKVFVNRDLDFSGLLPGAPPAP